MICCEILTGNDVNFLQCVPSGAHFQLCFLGNSVSVNSKLNHDYFILEGAECF